MLSGCKNRVEGVNEKILTIFFRCFYIKKSLLQNKEQSFSERKVSDFTQNRWSKDQKNLNDCKKKNFTLQPNLPY
jgi:hypothetical protein